ncbi:MAG: polyprenyl synthetase family protein [Chloroflexota bacterium]|nr:polyprenyl synthetase family protein [Chloroflexota bacterium]
MITDFTERLPEARQRINDRLKETTSPELYAITRDGKKLRGILTCLVCDMLTGDKPTAEQKTKALDLACTVEVVHSLTLAADDIIDQDEMRRGKPSLYTLKGFSTAFLEIISGLSVPYSMVSPYGPEYVTAVSETQREMCAGVLKEILKDMPATRLYEIVIDKKTGALFALAARFGAMAADTPDNNIETMSKFGLHLGRAFQIKDDIDDFIEVVTGKKEPDAITGTEFLLLRGMKIDEILKEWGGDIAKCEPDFSKISQVKQLFQLYELLDTLNNRLEVEVQRGIDAIREFDDRAVLQRYLSYCVQERYY